MVRLVARYWAVLVFSGFVLVAPSAQAEEVCAAAPSQNCILALAERAQADMDETSTDDARAKDIYSAYIAAFRGDIEAVGSIMSARYADYPDIARVSSGEILAEVGQVEAALTTLGQIKEPFPASKGNIQSPPRRRFEAAYLLSAEWMIKRGDSIRQVLRAIDGRLYTLDQETHRLTGMGDSSRLDLAETLMRSPDRPSVIKMFTEIEGTNEATRGRAWAIRFIFDQDPATATERSVMEALRAAEPSEYGQLYALEMMASRMASVGDALHAYLLAKKVPSAFNSGADVNIDVLAGMESLIEALSVEDASTYLRWTIDRSVQSAGSAASLAYQWAKIGGVLRDIGQADAALAVVESSEAIFRSSAIYPGRSNPFQPESSAADSYIRVLGESGWEGRALKFIQESPEVDRRKAFVELLRGMNARDRRM